MTAWPHPLSQTVLPAWAQQRPVQKTSSLSLFAYLTLFVDVVALVVVEVTNIFLIGLHGLGANFGGWLLANLVAIVVAIAFLHRREFITPRRLTQLRSQVKQNVLAILFAGLIGSTCLLMIDAEHMYVSRWITVWIAGNVVSLFAARTLLAEIVRRWLETGRLDYKIAVIGKACGVQAFSEHVLRSEQLPVRVVGLYTPHSCATSTVAIEAESPLLRGDLDILVLDSRVHGIDAIVFLQSELSSNEILDAYTTLESCASDFYILPGIDDALPENAQFRVLGTSSVVAVKELPLKGWQVLAKSAFDKVMAAALLLMMLPLFGIVMILIRLDSAGPIFFRQLRTGYNNTLFSMLKFRTMYHHLEDRQAAAQTTQDDRRVTHVGRILRKFSIDELPQLINVLRGDMSLVGPRPHAPGTSVNGIRVDDLIEGYARRHHVRPGLTGLAQVNGSRGCMTTSEDVARRLQYDLKYIENWSFWLDCKILVFTAVREIVSRNAY